MVSVLIKALQVLVLASLCCSFAERVEGQEQQSAASVAESGPVNPEERPSMGDLKWKSQWRPGLSVNSTIATLFLGVGSLVAITSRHPRVALWDSSSMDESVRNAIVSDNPITRNRIAGASDVMVGVLQLWPVLLDAVVMAYGVAKNPKLMGHLLAINLQAFAVSSFLNTVAKFALARQRPYSKHETCPEGECGDPNLSFFSGHTSGAFTAASLVCVHRRHMRIFGKVLDPIACGASVVAATAVGVMRIAADKHWVTDVLAGALVGIISGWILPRFVYYRRKGPSRPMVSPFATTTSAGLVLSGTL